jgi:hypothetical protein
MFSLPSFLYSPLLGINTHIHIYTYKYKKKERGEGVEENLSTTEQQ